MTVKIRSNIYSKGEILETNYIPVINEVLEKLMSNKLSSDTSIVPITEKLKDYNQKYSLSKVDMDLYNEELYVESTLIEVKKVSMPNKGVKWKIMVDNKVIFIIESNKISKSEREYLEKVDGFNFILAQTKLGIKSLNKLRNELKKIIKPKKLPKTKQKKSKTK